MRGVHLHISIFVKSCIGNGVNALSACALSCAYVLFLVKHLCVLANKETVDTVVAGFLFIIGMNAAACHNNDICARFKGLTVLDLLELSAEEKLPRDKVCSLLGEVGLCSKEYINREADSSLSGGESKRIEIATVLARKNASMLVFDEPEAGIDLWSFSNLIEAFERLKAEGSRSLLVISHQERIMEIADNIVVIAGGKVRTCGKKDDVLPTLLADEKTERCPMDKAKREVRA